jgi:hypothetical protein
MAERFEFEYETRTRPLALDRLPRWGTVVVLAACYRDAFDTAFAMLYGRRDVEQVTLLQLVL